MYIHVVNKIGLVVLVLRTKMYVISMGLSAAVQPIDLVLKRLKFFRAKLFFVFIELEMTKEGTMGCADTALRPIEMTYISLFI